MSRIGNTLLYGTATWVLLITLLSAYMLLSGRYVLVDGRSKAGSEGSLTAAEPPRIRLNHNQLYPHRFHHRSGLNFDEALRGVLASEGKGSDLQRVIALSSLLPPITNISRIPTPSREHFINYIAPVGLPVVFTDMLVGTKLDNWSWDMVQERWGQRVYTNTRQGNYSSRVNRYGKHFINRVDIKLSDFIDVVTGKREASSKERGLYITKQRVLPTKELEELFYYPPFYPGDHKKCYLEPTGWIGAPGTFTQGHIDSKDNFVYQLIGMKKWTIFPPQDYKLLYYHKEKGSLEWSAVLSQQEQPDLSKYPLYEDTHPVSFIMRPGEVLYLPRAWTHFVENITPSLMLNTWRRGPAAILELWSPKNRAGIKKVCY